MVLRGGTSGWYFGVVLRGGTSRWYFGVVLWGGTLGWYFGVVLGGTSGWYFGVVLFSCRSQRSHIETIEKYELQPNSDDRLTTSPLVIHFESTAISHRYNELKPITSNRLTTNSR